MAGPFDTLVHLGDGDEDAETVARILGIELISLAGNCDIGSTAPRELVREWEGHRLLMTHGDLFGVKSGLSRLRERAVVTNAQAILYGHSHRADISNSSDRLFVNPGTLMRSARRLSVAIMDITDAGITASLLEIT